MSAAAAVSALLVAHALAAGAMITTVAGTGVAGASGDGGPAPSAQLFQPRDAAPLSSGGYLVVDAGNWVVRKVHADGRIERVAGNYAQGDSGDGGSATSALFVDPASASPSADGGFLVVDRGAHRVRKVWPDGRITTLAGTGSPGFAGDGGPATNAVLRSPSDAVELDDGSVLIADSGNQRVRRISAAGAISTVAGGGGGDGEDSTSTLQYPVDISLLADGGFLVADVGSGLIRRVTASGGVITVAGNPAGSAGDGGLATDAYLATPVGVAALRDGGFLIAERGRNKVRRVLPDATIVTDAGDGSAGSSGDGGPAASAQVSAPSDVDVRPTGGYYISDTGNHRVRSVDSTDLPAVPPVGAADTAAPEAPAFTSTPGSAGTATSVTWAFTAEPGAALQCRLTHESMTLADWAECTSPTTHSLSTDGSHAFEVRAIDGSGNVSAVATSGYRLDRAAPAAPKPTVVPGSTGRAIDPSFTWTAEVGASAQCRVRRETTEIRGWTTCSSPFTADLSTQADGTYVVDVRLTDEVGNVGAAGAASYALDRVAPGAPVLSGTSEPGDATPTRTIAAEAATTTECALERAGVLVVAWAACVSPHTWDLAAQPDGLYALAARAVDAAGNASVPATQDYALSRADGMSGRSAPPVLAKRAVAGTLAGTIRVKAPGRARYVALGDSAAIPIGAIVDARRGKVALTTALDRHGRTQTATFSAGAFQIRQSRNARGMVDIHLHGGSRKRCRSGKRAASPRAVASARRKRKRVVRRLWGQDRGGRYRTHGQNSVATVRGTRWLTEDRCNGTLTRVTEGSVSVKAHGSRRSVLVRAGHQHLAPRKP